MSLADISAKGSIPWGSHVHWMKEFYQHFPDNLCKFGIDGRCYARYCAALWKLRLI